MNSITTLNQNETSTISGGKASDFIPSLETIAGFTVAVFTNSIFTSMAIKAINLLIPEKHQPNVHLKISIANSLGVIISYELGIFLWQQLVYKMKY